MVESGRSIIMFWLNNCLRKLVGLGFIDLNFNLLAPLFKLSLAQEEGNEGVTKQCLKPNIKYMTYF